MKLKAFLVRAIHRMGGNPVTGETLFDTASVARGAVTRSEVDDAIRDLESQGLISGARNELLDTITWTLTEKGKHAALQLP